MTKEFATRKRSHLIGSWQDEHEGRLAFIAEIELTETRLSITGTTRTTDARRRRRDNGFVSGGQNIEDLNRVTDFATGWDAQKRDQLAMIWRLYHLNDMLAGCIHQRADGWRVSHQYDATQDALGAAIAALEAKADQYRDEKSDAEAWKIDRHVEQIQALRHARRDRIGEACPICWYKFGFAWLREPLPPDVLAIVFQLTGSDDPRD